MSIPVQNFSLKEVQLLCSQIFHDLISPFSALAAGIDLLQDDIMDDADLTQMIQQSKNQLQNRITLFRVIFGYGSQDQEVFKTFEDYLNEAHILLSIVGKKPDAPKILISFAFWMIRQTISRTGCLSIDYQSETHFKLKLTDISLRKDAFSEEQIILGQKNVCITKEIYAGYLHCLLKSLDLKIDMEKTESSFALFVQPLLHI